MAAAVSWGGSVLQAHLREDDVPHQEGKHGREEAALTVTASPANVIHWQCTRGSRINGEISLGVELHE